jgi:hypothetical protein
LSGHHPSSLVAEASDEDIAGVDYFIAELDLSVRWSDDVVERIARLLEEMRLNRAKLGF